MVKRIDQWREGAGNELKDDEERDRRERDTVEDGAGGYYFDGYDDAGRKIGTPFL